MSACLEINFQSGCAGELALLFVEAQEFFEAEFERGGNIEEVRGATADFLIVSRPDLVGAATNIRVVQGHVNEKHLGVEIFLNLAKYARAVGGGNSFGPNKQPNRIAHLQTVMRRKGQGLPPAPRYKRWRDPFAPVREDTGRR